MRARAPREGKPIPLPHPISSTSRSLLMSAAMRYRKYCIASCSGDAGRPHVSVTVVKSVFTSPPRGEVGAHSAPGGEVQLSFAKGKQCGFLEDVHVVAKRPAVHVLQAEPHLLRADQLSVGAVGVVMPPEDLTLVGELQRSPVRDPGAHLQEIALLVRVTRHLARDLRPRPDEAHLALQHIEELRNLVQFVAAE